MKVSVSRLCRVGLAARSLQPATTLSALSSRWPLTAGTHYILTPQHHKIYLSSTATIPPRGMKKVFPAVRAQARVVDLPYPGPLEQKPVGALQVEEQPVTTSLEHGALEARLLKSLSHVPVS